MRGVQEFGIVLALCWASGAGLVDLCIRILVP